MQFVQRLNDTIAPGIAAEYSSGDHQADKKALAAQGVDFRTLDSFPEPQGTDLMVYYVVTLCFEAFDNQPDSAISHNEAAKETPNKHQGRPHQSSWQSLWEMHTTPKIQGI